MRAVQKVHFSPLRSTPSQSGPTRERELPGDLNHRIVDGHTPNERLYDRDKMTTFRDSRLSWAVTGLTACYVAWTAFVLSSRVPTFNTLFSSLGAELPLATRLVLRIGKPAFIWPFAVLILTLLAVNELRNRDFRTRVVLSILVFMATACGSSVVTELLFQPMMLLIKQVG
jgi:hypothetical protein